MKRFFYFTNRTSEVFLNRVLRSSYVSNSELSAYRMLFGFLLLIYFLPSWTWLKDTPPAFFDPHILSFAYLTDNHLPPVFYKGADILMILFLVMVTIGVWSRAALIGIFVLCSIFYSYAYSYGKIDHHTSILIFTFFLLAFTNCGSRFALMKDKTVPDSVQRVALGIVSIVICFGFFSAGITKCIKWIDFDLDTSGFLSWFNLQYFLDDKNKYFLMEYVFHLPKLVLELMDYTAAVFEVSGFFFLLRGKRSWLTFLFMASIFHCLTLILINIDFTLALLVYGIFLISPFLKRFLKKENGSLKKLRYFFYGIIGWGIIKIAFILFKVDDFVLNYHSIAYESKLYINLFLTILFIITSGYFLFGKKGYDLKQ